MSAQRTRNRCIRLLILAVICGFTLAFFKLMEIALRPTAIYTGFLLFALIFFLALYDLRKRIRFLPIGSAQAWLQFHVYTGIYSGLVFAIHVGWHIPNGLFEGVLALIYLFTFCSGLVGLFLSRSFAKRLATSGGEILFTRIPAQVAVLRLEVESLVMNYLAQSDSTALPEFYATRLRPYFATSKNVFHHLVQSSRPRTALLQEIRGFERYLDEKERAIIKQISDNVVLKDKLDYQYALQLALKVWLFVHVPLTFALMVFGTIHLLLVVAFTGRMG